MNVLFIFFLLIGADGHIAFGYRSNNHLECNTTLLYKVTTIKSYDAGYVIYAQRNDSTFRILTYKHNGEKICGEITVNHNYSFRIKSCFEQSIVPREHLGGKHLGKDIIPMKEEGTVSDIFYDERLEGLCFSVRE